jgi:hypothetical protein
LWASCRSERSTGRLRTLAQSPSERPTSIADIKASIQHYEADAVSLQRISKIDGTVVRAEAVDEPLAEEPPRLISATWDQGQLTLILDRPVTEPWIQALHNMESYGSVMGKPPVSFSFGGKQATVSAQEHEVQEVIDHFNFKSWLPVATRTLKQRLQIEAQKRESERREQLRRDREEEERRLRVNRSIRI